MRMAGLAHPNLLGQFSALGAGLGVVLASCGILRWRFAWVIALPCLAALALSISRAATVALIVALVVSHRDRIIQTLGWPLLAGLGAAVTGIALGVVALDDPGNWLSGETLSALSKTGDVRELTSLTGRTEIWEYTIRQVAERPLLGFGPATSRIVLADHVGYTHNLWLNVMFCSGVIGLTFMVCLTAGRVFDVVFRPHRIVDFLIIYIFVNGLAENVILSFIAGAPTILFIIAVLWRAADGPNADVGSDYYPSHSLADVEGLP
jgi:O-antigen ligase